MRGCADAPYKIWDAFNCDSANTCTESGFNLGEDEGFIFHGNMNISPGNKAIEEITQHASGIATKGISPLFLGGDHAITYPLVKGLADKYKDLNILHFDAHPDLYDEFEGDRYYHSCPFARIMESGLAKRLYCQRDSSLDGHELPALRCSRNSKQCNRGPSRSGY